MKHYCITCGKFVCKLDMRKTENKDELGHYCKNCIKKKVEHVRGLFR
jgi:hypothetical protein